MARRPDGIPTEHDFAVYVRTLEPLGDEDVEIEVETISLDPYIRLRMAGRHLSDNLSPGDPVSSEVIGRVTRSRSSRFRAGDIVAGFSPWRERAVLPAQTLRSVDFGRLSASLALGVLGMPGLTAWAGVTQLLKVDADDVLVVSAAAGPVGATVGQLAKARGARVIGIAGGADKCRWLEEEAGFHDSIDYRLQDVGAALRRLVPDGPTGYFDNVGGSLLRTVTGCLRHYGRIVLCGIIADYNQSEPAPGPLPLEIIAARATVKGLVVYDFENRRNEMIAELRPMIEAGTLCYREDVAHGLGSLPGAFARLMRGENQGKALVSLT